MTSCISASRLLRLYLLIAFVDAEWYGSPLRSGYGSLDELYGLENIWPNLLFYVGWLLKTQTPLLLLAFASPAIAARAGGGAAVAALVAAIFPLAVLAQYLPYIVFEDWVYVRFLLPAYPALLAGTAAVVVSLAHRLTRPPIAVATTVLLVSGVVLRGFQYSSIPFALEGLERRYVETAGYAQRLPGNPVFLALLHSGSLRYYTGREVLRWDMLDPRYLDTAVAYLQQKGHSLYLVADAGEFARVHELFPGSRTVQTLDGATPQIVDSVSVYEVR